MGGYKPGRPHGGYTPSISTETTIPQQSPSYDFTPMGHVITNDANYITPVEIQANPILPSWHRHRHSWPTGLLTRKLNDTTCYPPQRKRSEKYSKTASLLTQLPFNKNRTHTSQYSNR
jgi:hypothetical protein